MLQNKSCRETRNTHFTFNNSPPETRAVYEIMSKYIVEPDWPQMKIQRMRIACWIPKATNTHTRNTQYLLLFHCNNGCTNAPQCYVIRTLSVTGKCESMNKGTYLLTPWSRVLLEKRTGSAASQEIPLIFGTRRFITVPTSARHLSLS